MKARMSSEPRSDLGMLVSRVVVGDQVQFKIGRHISIEMFQKAQEFLVAMARLDLTRFRRRCWGKRKKEVSNARNASTVRAGVPATNHRAGPRGALGSGA